MDADEFDDLRPDGELTLNELWAILTVEAIYFACVIRLVILANGKTGSSIWARTRYATSSSGASQVNTTCFEFNFSTYFSTPDPNNLQYLEYLYLSLCIFAVLRLPYELINILAAALKYRCPRFSKWILNNIQHISRRKV